MIRLGSADFMPDASGALWWPDEATLVVADLHLEKGSHYARHHTLLPPYDTDATLTRLEAAVACYRPERVLALGDSLHDAAAADRLGSLALQRLADLAAGRCWLWVTGNHDAAGLDRLGTGRVVTEIDLGGILFRHAAEPACAQPEVSGHYHPKASVSVHGRRLSRRCFVAGDTRLILPAFGAYTGGLDLRDAAFDPLFAGRFTAYLTGRERVIAVSAAHIFANRPLTRDLAVAHG